VRRPSSLPPALEALGASLVLAAGGTDDSDSGNGGSPAAATVQAEILRKALADGDLSRPGILRAEQNLGGADLGGVTPSVTCTPDGGPPATKTLITRIDPSVEGFLRSPEKSCGSEVADDLETDG
jgi:hypothetical protein